MPRIRSIKPEFFSHPEVTECSIPARLLLASLFTQADDDGRLLDQPRKIAGLGWGENDRVNTDAILSELHERGRISRYVVAGKRCIQVLNFSKHQAVPASKYRASILPADPSLTDDCLPAATAQPEGSLEVELGSGSGTGSGTRKPETGTGERALARGKPERPALNPLGFDDFWANYPRKVGKRKAQAEYVRALKRVGSNPDVLIIGAARYRDDPNREAEFTAHPTTWLNRDGWDDDPLPDHTPPPPALGLLDTIALATRREMHRNGQGDGAEHGGSTGSVLPALPPPGADA